MIEIDRLSFGYGRKKLLFDGFSLRLGAGNVVGLLGKNGTGKSTLLYLICGLLRPKSGRIELKGMDVSFHPTEMLSDVFLVPEEFSLPDIRITEYVKLNSPFYPRFSEETLRSCLSDFELEDDLRLAELSMGQKKKAFMSFALATNTSLLLMDEPTNGLDIPSKSQFRKVVSEGMNEGRTIVVSTHQVADIASLLSHIVIIDGSRLLLDMSVGDITEKLGYSVPLDVELLFNKTVNSK